MDTGIWWSSGDGDAYSYVTRTAGKNVAADIAEKLCASVSARLEGRQIGTLSRVSRSVHEAVHEACVQMLTPKRSIDILNEVLAAAPRPFVIVFCGVNGVGKSTNLAKASHRTYFTRLLVSYSYLHLLASTTPFDLQSKGSSLRWMS